MKTYTKTTQTIEPRLVIRYDSDIESPRKWDNLGYFYSKDGRHISPDGNNTDIYNIMIETGNEAGSQEEHIKLMTKRINKETGEKVLAIYPVVKYEHSSVSYSLGITKGFDYSNNSFYIVTDKTQKLLGTPKKFFEKVISQELKDYTAWANGEVYGYILYDKDGEEIDSCGGFYDIEDIRSSLPEEYKDEKLSDYIKY